MRTDRE